MMTDVRAHNEGTIYFRADRKAKVAGVIIKGRRHTRMCPHRNHRPSDRDCRESQGLLVGLLQLRDAGTSDPRRIRLGPFLESWVRSLDLAPATIRQHEMIVRVHLVPALGRRTLADLTPTDVEDYLSRTDLDGQTLRHHRATLRRALNRAIRDGILTRNPAALARAPKMGPKERTALDAVQVRRLLDHTDGDRWSALWHLGATCGLRVSEALGLAWSDVDGDTIHVRYQLARVNGEWVRAPLKTAKSRRDVTMPPRTVEALRRHRERQLAALAGYPQPLDEFVFQDEHGRPVWSSNVLPPLRKALRELGLPPVSFHDLRHAAATILYAEGMPLEAIADMLGHSTVRVTQDLYRHRVVELNREAARVMERAVG